MIPDRRAGVTFACYVFAVLLGLLIAYQDVVSLFGDDNGIFHKRDQIRGLRITEAPPVLRHFTAKFQEI